MMSDSTLESLVVIFKGQGQLDNSPEGSRGPNWAIALHMMMMMMTHLNAYVGFATKLQYLDLKIYNIMSPKR